MNEFSHPYRYFSLLFLNYLKISLSTINFQFSLIVTLLLKYIRFRCKILKKTIFDWLSNVTYQSLVIGSEQIRSHQIWGCGFCLARNGGRLIWVKWGWRKLSFSKYHWCALKNSVVLDVQSVPLCLPLYFLSFFSFLGLRVYEARPLGMLVFPGFNCQFWASYISGPFLNLVSLGQQ